MLITILTNTTIGKWIYGTVFSFSTIGLMQESVTTNTGFLETLLQNIPAQVIYILGIVYGISLVLGKLSDAWTKHRMNNLKVKQEKEHLEQEEIITERKRKSLV